MLADAVESSSRALSEPTPGSLRKLVHDLLMKRLLDGQFEESGLTLTELHIDRGEPVQGPDRPVPLAHQVSRSPAARAGVVTHGRLVTSSLDEASDPGGLRLHEQLQRRQHVLDIGEVVVVVPQFRVIVDGDRGD